MLAKSCAMGLEGIVSKLAELALCVRPTEKLAEIKMHQAPGICDRWLYRREIRPSCHRRLHLGYDDDGH